MKEQVFFHFWKNHVLIISPTQTESLRKSIKIILYLLISARLNYLEIVTVSKAKQTF